VLEAHEPEPADRFRKGTLNGNAMSGCSSFVVLSLQPSTQGAKNVMRLALTMSCILLGLGGVACGPADENAADETSEDVAEAESALNYTFTVPKNPTSVKSNALKITVTPGSGGVIKWFTVGDDSPFFENYTGVLNSQAAVIRTTYLPCASYGTSYVNVEYTGPFPKLNYWWTDCK
jgi:hypothetical protein